MADPICRWRNATPETICEIIEQLPKKEMSEDEFRKIMLKSKWGESFNQTVYQLACQTALYYIDDNKIYHPRFTENITKEEAEKYLHHWFHLYYIPNPYTRKGFNNLEKPQYFERTLFENLQKQNPSNDFSKLLNETFKDEIGELDILKNLINRYSDLLKVEDNKIKIEIKEKQNMEINVDRNDKKSFFDSFNKNNNVPAIPHPHNRIIFGAPGTGKSFRLNKEANESKFAEITRVTFHPDYSYSQFVGTYKPVMVKSKSKATDENVSQTIEILQDKTKSAQEKYDSLYDKFKDNNLTTLPFLLGLYTDDSFTTLKKDGSATADDNSAERNHGKAIRPYVNLKSQDDDETISYRYVPGPFLRTLVAALKSGKSGNPQNYLLIIEEINRARVAAVFGDVFQLLDRNADGESEYEIQTSEDMRNYLAEQLGGNPCEYKTLKLPNNFYIWATMNSADQGVFPMDTAFKRRWNFEYIGVNDKETVEQIKDMKLPIKDSDGKWSTIKWDSLRQAINKRLLSVCKVNEDKLLGAFFISKTDLEKANKCAEKEDDESIKEKEKFINLFKSKVLMYLYEDAAKMHVGKFFVGVNPDEMTYSKVCDEFERNGIEVFGEDFKKEVDSASQNGESN